ncbi:MULTISPECIES: tautomerase family protein [Pantoea]|uniref:tautomerase family protein n=1 Tax=Pantoea TaxID=53335 RepID=UPI0012327F0A|nr:tautomerase family protein [Pantoea sp. M_9]KAA5971503.1 4-oxalocrotonate tautomerase [Pantoea sp. M_9]
MPEIVINLAAGRDKKQKEKLMQEVFIAVKNSLDVKDEYIVISLNETPRDNKSRGGKLFSEE